jgi:hypothetical protein
MKKLIIISGITGAIGNALLPALVKDYVIYGISRKGLPMSKFINEKTQKFFDATFICSIDGLDASAVEKFTSSIDYHLFSKVIYIHAVGLYPFEVNEHGEHVVENDIDGDGINDDVMNLTHNYLTEMISSIGWKCLTNNIKPFSAVTFGGIADVHQPIVHESWWKTMQKTKIFLKQIGQGSATMHILNLSSVICAHEVMTRPFVFINTNAEPQYWLTPEEVAQKVKNLIADDRPGFFEEDLFHWSPYYKDGYYSNEKFTPRKVKELF